MNSKQYQLNNCLKKYRKGCGLKQGYVAHVLGLKNVAMVSRWENGKCLPDSANTFRLSILYKTMPEALFIDMVRVLRKEIAERESKFKPESAIKQKK
ncbi:helix-turn-helix transcriptional regulator [Candidatus Nomurabacteria bacterium]|nr:helix-turn-helix transcriptional regulator [Candidatus Nomurabacteria bacterium]